MINEADQLDLEAQECINQIERNDSECLALHADIAEKRRYTGELMGKMANLRTRLINLQRVLQEKKGEFEETWRRVFRIRDEEDRHAIAASYKEEEAYEAEEHSKEVEREAQELELELEQLCGRAV